MGHIVVTLQVACIAMAIISALVFFICVFGLVASWLSDRKLAKQAKNEDETFFKMIERFQDDFAS